MNKTATRLLVLTLVLSLCLLTACGADKGDFSAVLDGGNATLDGGEHITVKRGAIKGLTMEDSLSWELELPFYGFYEFEMEFALDDGEEERDATLYLENLDTHQKGRLSCGYWPTDAWNKTDVSSVGITVPAGNYSIKLIPDGGTDFERFIDLIKIDVIGTVREDPGQVLPADTTEQTQEETQEEPEIYEGDWWVHPEGYESEGISLLDVFMLPDGGDIAFCCDPLGQVVMEAPVTWEDDTVTLDLGLTTVTMRYDGHTMSDPEDGEVFFVRTNDPGFRERENYDGVWYLDGDPASGARYEVTDDQIIWYGTDYSGETSKESTWEYGASSVLMPDGSQMDITPCLEQAFPEPALYPILGGKALLEEDMFTFNIYIREDALEEEGILEKAQDVLTLTSHPWMGMDAEGRELELRFYPNYFQIKAVVREESGYHTDPELGFYGGTWEMTSADALSLTYTDGTQEDAVLGEMLMLENTGAEFMPAE